MTRITVCNKMNEWALFRFQFIDDFYLVFYQKNFFEAIVC